MLARPEMPREHVGVILAALHTCRAEAGEGELKMGRLFDRLGDASFSFICFIHTLPFLQPLSLGPISTAAGVSLLALGGQMAKGRETPWLPARMREMKLSGRVWRILILTAEKALEYGRRITRPRLPALVTGLFARRLAGVIIAVSGILLAVPLPGMPFSNTLPALAVLFVCLGELEEDGAMVLLSLVMVVLTLVYFGVLGWLLFWAGDAALDRFRS